jgi:hypothetical protein
MTEQEIFAEYMRLCDLQEQGSGRHNSKGFFPGDSVCDQVYQLMGKMREAGLKESETSASYFINWFFKCKYQTFSICVYGDGWMELRWG